MANVVPFDKLSPSFALRLVHETAKNSVNIIMKDPPDMGEWQRLTNHRQVVACLQDGELVDGPHSDEHGNTVCTLKRFSCGVCLWVTVILFKQDANWKLYVMKVEKEP